MTRNETVSPETRGRKRNETGGMLDPYVMLQRLTRTEAIHIIFNTSPKSLEQISKGKVTSGQWRTHKANYKGGSMTLDKQEEIMDALGFYCQMEARYGTEIKTK